MEQQAVLSRARVDAIAADTARFPKDLMDAIGFAGVIALYPEGRARVRFDGPARLAHSGGAVIQGGILGVWLDHAMAWAVCAREAGAAIATLEMKVSYLGRVGPGPCVADVRVARWGRRVVFLEGTLSQPEGTVVVTASSTAMRLGG
jgi:acyl-coenzyme A thioesterase PaaI-like protein